jgi:hypothetical protein
MKNTIKTKAMLSKQGNLTGYKVNVEFKVFGVLSDKEAIEKATGSKFFFEEKFFDRKNWKVYYTMIENEKTAIFAVNEKGEKQLYNSDFLCDLIIKGVI